MSPGSQMRALTANKAKANSSTIKAGKTVDRKKDTELTPWRRHCDGPIVGAVGAAATGQERRRSDPANH